MTDKDTERRDREQRIREVAETGILLGPSMQHFHSGDILLLLDTLKQERERAGRLETTLKKFKVWGTDGCRTCETGRITMFVANERCIQCDPEAYETPQEDGV